MFYQFWQVAFIVFTMIIATKIVGDRAIETYSTSTESAPSALFVAFND